MKRNTVLNNTNDSVQEPAGSPTLGTKESIREDLSPIRAYSNSIQ